MIHTFAALLLNFSGYLLSTLKGNGWKVQPVKKNYSMGKISYHRRLAILFRTSV